MLLKILQRLKSENFYWNIGFYALVLAGLTHFLFIFLFIIFGIPQMVILNVVSVLVYLYCIFGLAIKTLDSSDDSIIGWLVYFELMGHGVIATYLLGLESGFQYYIYALLFIPFFVGTYTVLVRFFRALGIIVVALLLEIYGHRYDPVITLHSDMIVFLHYMNLTFVLVMIAAISYLYTVNGIIYQKLLFEKSNNDPLTKLYNRRYVDEVFANNTISDKKHLCSFALLLIDIDYFKKVNDSYGHRYGDDVLVYLAKILRQNVRKTNIISRWGGEEFLIVFEDSNKNELLSTAERLRKVVECTVMNEEKFIQITITLGGAVSEEEESFEKTLSRADKALYEGKENGRNQVIIV